jgi:hypothetical protein
MIYLTNLAFLRKKLLQVFIAKIVPHIQWREFGESGYAPHVPQFQKEPILMLLKIITY